MQIERLAILKQMSISRNTEEHPHLYIIEVKGSIVSEEGNQYAQGWVAGSVADANKESWAKEHYDEITHSFDSDLRLNKKMRAVPYAVYVANGSVGLKEASEASDLTCIPGYAPAFLYLDEYLKEIDSYLDIAFSSIVEDVFYNGLYVSTFGILELFLCDFLLCGIFSNGENYSRACALYCADKNAASAIEMENTIRNAISKKVFHQFDSIGHLYSEILGIDFPNTERLKRLIHKRHNVVHRYAISNIDRMSVCDASKADVRQQIEEIRTFSSGLWERV